MVVQTENPRRGGWQVDRDAKKIQYQKKHTAPEPAGSILRAMDVYIIIGKCFARAEHLKLQTKRKLMILRALSIRRVMLQSAPVGPALQKNFIQAVNTCMQIYTRLSPLSLILPKLPCRHALALWHNICFGYVYEYDL